MNSEVPAKSTPKKIYIRSSVCRLCGGANESSHASGFEQNWS